MDSVKNCFTLFQILAEVRTAWFYVRLGSKMERDIKDTALEVNSRVKSFSNIISLRTDKSKIIAGWQNCVEKVQEYIILKRRDVTEQIQSFENDDLRNK